MATACFNPAADCEEEDVCPICIDIYTDPISLAWFVIAII